MIKSFKYIMVILSICVIGILSFILIKNNNDARVDYLPKLSDGFFFLEWNSFHGYYTDEEPFLELNYITSEKIDPVTSIINASLISNKGLIPVNIINNLQGPQTNEFSLYTLNLSIPSLDDGEYNISGIKFSDSKNNIHEYSIGQWVLIKGGINNNDFTIGQKTILSGAFQTYTVEIKNISDRKITITGLYMNFINDQYDVSMDSADNYYMNSNISTELSIEPGKIRAIRFQFRKKDNSQNNLSEFVSLRPIIHYVIDGNEKQCILPTVIFSPSLSQQQIREMLK